MARLIGYVANRADRIRDAFHQEREAIMGLDTQHRRAWGIGFYNGDEVLHKKQPTPDGEPVDWEAVTERVRTDCAIAHVRKATVGGFSVDNTHPFRWRQWLFAHVGTVTAFEDIGEELMADVPDYLRRNVRGNADSEAFFHLVLTELHSSGQIKLDEPDEQGVVDAIGAAVARIDRVVGPVRPTSTLNMLMTNGRRMYGLRRGSAFGYMEQTGLHDPAEGSVEEERPGSPLLRYVMLISGGDEVPGGYQPLDDGGVVVVDRELDVRTLSL